jgi:hypothetical protein
MLRFRRLPVSALSLFGLAGADVPAPPAMVPGGIVNTASHLPAWLRGAALAPGMRFTIPSVRLGPEIAVRSRELDPPAKLADVSVRTGRASGQWMPACCWGALPAWKPGCRKRRRSAKWNLR